MIILSRKIHIKVDVHGKNVAVFITLYHFPSFRDIILQRKKVEKNFWGRKFEFWGKSLVFGIENFGNTKGFQHVNFDFYTFFVDAVRLGFLIFFLVSHIWLG